MYKRLTVKVVEEEGVPLEVRSLSPRQPEIPKGKVLVAICRGDDPGDVSALDVTDSKDYDALYAEYDSHLEFDLDRFYLLDEGKISTCQ